MHKNNNLFLLHILGELEQTLQLMLLKLSAIEQKWLIRLLLKNMNLGVAHTNILDAYHCDANALYDVCQDLIKVIYFSNVFRINNISNKSFRFVEC